MITKQQTLDTNNERNALAMALYNLCVRNNINPQDFIKTMKDTRKNIRKRYANKQTNTWNNRNKRRI